MARILKDERMEALRRQVKARAALLPAAMLVVTGAAQAATSDGNMADANSPTEVAGDPPPAISIDQNGVYLGAVFIAGPTYIDPIGGGWFYGDIGRLMALQSAAPNPAQNTDPTPSQTADANPPPVDLISSGLGPTSILPAAPTRRVPEPASAAMLATALMGLALMRRRLVHAIRASI